MTRPLTWLLVPLFLLLQYEIWFAPGGLVSIWRVDQQVKRETALNQQLLARNQAIATEIHDLKNGSAAIEDHARTDMGMVKPGEVLYQLP